MYCKYCGKQIDDDSIFCCRCGEQVTTIKNNSSHSTSKTTNDTETIIKDEQKFTVRNGIIYDEYYFIFG